MHTLVLKRSHELIIILVCFSQLQFRLKVCLLFSSASLQSKSPGVPQSQAPLSLAMSSTMRQLVAVSRV